MIEDVLYSLTIEWKSSNFYAQQIKSDEINSEVVRLHHNDNKKWFLCLLKWHERGFCP